MRDVPHRRLVRGVGLRFRQEKADQHADESADHRVLHRLARTPTEERKAGAEEAQQDRKKTLLVQVFENDEREHGQSGEDDHGKLFDASGRSQTVIACTHPCAAFKSPHLI